MIEEKLMNILGTRKFTRIFSSKTNNLYMDNAFRCYLFESPGDAGAFAKATEDVYPKDENAYIKTGQFLTQCYADGFDLIRMKTAASGEYTDIPLKKKDVKKQYFNREANRDITMFKETWLAKYLRDLYHREFLCPVLIEKRQPGKYPGVHYATAVTGDGLVCHILFTTLQAFDSWNGSNNNKFLPNKTGFAEFASIRKERAVIINPETDRLFLDDKTISKIKGKKKEAQSV